VTWPLKTRTLELEKTAVARQWLSKRGKVYIYVLVNSDIALTMHLHTVLTSANVCNDTT
jgi:hypothetical protein